MNIPSWIENGELEVWLVGGDGHGLILDLAQTEEEASRRSSLPAVLAANADATDMKRIEQLLNAGYVRAFSMVKLQADAREVDTAPFPTFRSATNDDAAAMLALTERVWADRDYFSMPDIATYESWLGRSDLSLFLLIHDAGELVAYIASRIDDDGGMEIEDIQVAPTHQRQGLGRHLVRATLCAAYERECSHVWLTTEGEDPVGARSFYERQGFRLADEALRFRKPMPEPETHESQEQPSS